MNSRHRSAHNKYSQLPDITLDFHGYTTSECRDILDEFFVQHAGESIHIRIIVGKGINSAHGAVLPDFVRNYLHDHNIRFSSAKIQDGGEGALEVFLEK